jgi:GntR family transcriptional regulator, galactonate operon transcriptional repressor
MSRLLLKRNLYTQVVHELGLRIVRGDLKPGDTFPAEPDFSQELGISRTVTREAIKALTEKGMVVSRKKIGTQVQPRSNWNLLDPDILHWEYEAGPRNAFLQRLTEFRLIIEPAASEMAARRASPEEISLIERAYQDMVDAVDEPDKYIDADMRFHAAIVRATHNDLLERVVHVTRTALVSSRIVTVQRPGSSRDALPLHRAVIDAIINKQSQMAYDAMHNLINRARRDIDTIIGPDELS